MQTTPSLVSGTYRVTLALTGAGEGTSGDSAIFYVRTFAHGSVPIAIAPNDPNVTHNADRAEEIDYRGGYMLNVVAAAELVTLPAAWDGSKGLRLDGGGMFVVVHNPADVGTVAHYRGSLFAALDRGRSTSFDRIADALPVIRERAGRKTEDGPSKEKPKSIAEYPGSFSVDATGTVTFSESNLVDAGRRLIIRAVGIAPDAY